MSPSAAVLLHVLFDLATGWAILRSLVGPPLHAAHVAPCFLVGAYFDTLVCGTAVLLGCPLEWAMAVSAVFAAGVVWRTARSPLPQICHPRTPSVMWFEWLVVLSLVEKVAFALWQLVRTPLYFDDASTHWAGRARALYGAVNWSLDPASPVYLGTRAGLGHNHYPLWAVVWRAETAVMSGGWDDVVARADGLVLFLCVVSSVWGAVWQFSHSRWYAAAAAYVASAVPLFTWHIAAGYSDITVAAYAVAGLAALLRREWAVAGLSPPAPLGRRTTAWFSTFRHCSSRPGSTPTPTAGSTEKLWGGSYSGAQA